MAPFLDNHKTRDDEPQRKKAMQIYDHFFSSHEFGLFYFELPAKLQVQLFKKTNS